jgi:BirA family biotin operon repressor/biotin-[acetyl-CoA-carboxylase] ligase
MDVAKQHINAASANSNIMVIANEQSAGRGRQGRKWQSDQSGLYVTYALKLDEKVDLSGLSLMVGYSLLSSLNDHKGQLKLKWPNDILDQQGRKLSGILIETGKYNNSSWVLIGVGVNINAVNSLDLATISLKELGIEVTAHQLAVQLYVQLISDWMKFLEHGFSAFRASWLENCGQLNKEIIVANLQGLMVDVNDNGRLVLKASNGTLHTISVGDVLIPQIS